MMLAAACALFALASSRSDSAPPPPLTVGGYLDLYYAIDFAHPVPPERAYTTQAVRHNEANVNLAAATFAVTGDRVRAMLTLQAGTSVQANYAGEPREGPTSGADLSRHLQEAFVGIRLAADLWLDGGITLGSLGWESWTSRDNPTYTRSLVAEYTPYYESGIRLVWDAKPGLVVQGHLMNGWQKISEDNAAKSASVRVDLALIPGLTVAAAGFLGNEQPRGAPPATRYFGQLMLKTSPHRDLLVQAQLDGGRQRLPDRMAHWWGAVGIARLALRRRLALVARVERFADPDQVVASTGTPEGFLVSGGSVGVDVLGPAGLLWRTELRGLRASGRIFPDATGPAGRRTNAALITSLALTL